MGLEEVSTLLDMPPRFVEARLRMGGFFPGAWEDGDGWHIPERAVRHCLGCRVRPLFSIQTAAGLLEMSYDHTFKQTAVVESLDSPLPVGKTIRALFLFLGSGKPVKRIHEDELLRLQGIKGKGKP